MIFFPDPCIRKGEQIRFQLRNDGEVDHEFVDGTIDDNLRHMEAMAKNPDMEHDDPNAKRLKPKTTGEIVWQFTNAGTFDFSCLFPASPSRHVRHLRRRVSVAVGRNDALEDDLLSPPPSLLKAAVFGE